MHVVEFNFSNINRMILIYIIIFAVIDIYVYLLVNKIIRTNVRNLAYLFGSISLLIVLHSEIIRFPGLLSFNNFLYCFIPLASNLMISAGAKLFIIRDSDNSFMDDKTRARIAKIESFIFFKVVYFFTFIAQIIFIINF